MGSFGCSVVLVSSGVHCPIKKKSDGIIIINFSPPQILTPWQADKKIEGKAQHSEKMRSRQQKCWRFRDTEENVTKASTSEGPQIFN